MRLSLEAVKPPFSYFARETDRSQGQAHAMKAKAMLSGVVLLSFGFLGEVKPVVHLIREDLIAVLCPIWVDRPRSCNNGDNVRLF